MAPKTQRQIAVRRAAAARHAALNRLPGRAGHCLRNEQVLRFVRQVRISCAIISDGPETSDAIFCFTQALVCLRWFLPVLRKYIIFEFLASSLEYRHASRAGALKIPMVHREVAEDRKEHRHVSLGEMNQIKRRVLRPALYALRPGSSAYSWGEVADQRARPGQYRRGRLTRIGPGNHRFNRGARGFPCKCRGKGGVRGTHQVGSVVKSRCGPPNMCLRGIMETRGPG